MFAWVSVTQILVALVLVTQIVIKFDIPLFLCVCVCFPPFFSLTEMDLWIDSQFD